VYGSEIQKTCGSDVANLLRIIKENSKNLPHFDVAWMWLGCCVADLRIHSITPVYRTDSLIFKKLDNSLPKRTIKKMV
jgi:hypothetical protein